VDVTPKGNHVLMGTFLVAHHPAKILFDIGASHTFHSKDFAMHHNISIQEVRWGVAVQSLKGN
jgi:hypothetical protein